MKAFVLTRDRVTYAERCIEALMTAGLDVVVVDHGSTWIPMLDLLDRVRHLPAFFDGLPRLIRSENRHPRDLWRPDGPIATQVHPGERFIVTDCDVVPAKDCPPSWVHMLSELLDKRPAAVKVGLGLRTSDLPPWFAHRKMVRAWEAKYQAPMAAPVLLEDAQQHGVWADIDTTLAMYRRYEPFKLGPAIRTSAPFEALHLPWYEDSANPTDEQAFYAKHAQHGHWRNPDGYADDHGLESGS